MDAAPLGSVRRSVLALERIVVEQLLDEVDVAHEHAAAAVAGEIQGVEGVALGVIRLEEVQVSIPLVSDDLREPGGGSGRSGARGGESLKMERSVRAGRRERGRGRSRTLPHVKQRTGMIIARDEGRFGPWWVSEPRGRV